MLSGDECEFDRVRDLKTGKPRSWKGFTHRGRFTLRFLTLRCLKIGNSSHSDKKAVEDKRNEAVGSTIADEFCSRVGQFAGVTHSSVYLVAFNFES